MKRKVVLGVKDKRGEYATFTKTVDCESDDDAITVVVNDAVQQGYTYYGEATVYYA